MGKALVTELLVAAGYGAVSRCKSQSGNIRNIVRYGMCIVCKGRRTASLYVQSTQKPSKPQISQTFPVAEVNESGHQGSDPSKTQIPKKPVCVITRTERQGRCVVSHPRFTTLPITSLYSSIQRSSLRRCPLIPTPGFHHNRRGARTSSSAASFLGCKSGPQSRSQPIH